jgi:hypothetical protein
MLYRVSLTGRHGRFTVPQLGYLGYQPADVVTENYVRSENKEVPINREIMVATTMSSLFVALFALLASSFPSPGE